MQAAAEEHLSAAGCALGTDLCAVQHTDVAAQQFHAATRGRAAFGGAVGLHGAGHPQRALAPGVGHQRAGGACGCAGNRGLAAGGEVQGVAGAQFNLPAFAGQRGGAHQTLLVDQRSLQVDATAFHAAQVQGLAARRLHPQRDVGRASIGQVDAFARGQHHLPAWRLNQPFVAHLAGAHQHDAPTAGAAQLTLVADGGVAGQAGGEGLQQRAALHPVVVGQVQRRRDQTGHVHPRTRTEHHAVRVQQPHLAVARQAAEDGRRVAAQHTVQHLAGRMRLLEVHGRTGADGKRLPVQDGLGAVGHRHLGATLRDVGAAMHSRHARGQRLGACRAVPHRRQQRHAGQRQGQRAQGARTPAAARRLGRAVAAGGPCGGAGCSGLVVELGVHHRGSDQN